MLNVTRLGLLLKELSSEFPNFKIVHSSKDGDYEEGYYIELILGTGSHPLVYAHHHKFPVAYAKALKMAEEVNEHAANPQ